MAESPMSAYGHFARFAGVVYLRALLVYSDRPAVQFSVVSVAEVVYV